MKHFQTDCKTPQLGTDNLRLKRTSQPYGQRAQCCLLLAFEVSRNQQITQSIAPWGANSEVLHPIVSVCAWAAGGGGHATGKHCNPTVTPPSRGQIAAEGG